MISLLSGLSILPHVFVLLSILFEVLTLISVKVRLFFTKMLINFILSLLQPTNKVITMIIVIMLKKWVNQGRIFGIIEACQKSSKIFQSICLTGNFYQFFDSSRLKSPIKVVEISRA